MQELANQQANDLSSASNNYISLCGNLSAGTQRTCASSRLMSALFCGHLNTRSAETMLVVSCR